MGNFYFAFHRMPPVIENAANPTPVIIRAIRGSAPEGGTVGWELTGLPDEIISGFDDQCLFIIRHRLLRAIDINPPSRGRKSRSRCSRGRYGRVPAADAQEGGTVGWEFPAADAPEGGTVGSPRFPPSRGRL